MSTPVQASIWIGGSEYMGKGEGRPTRIYDIGCGGDSVRVLSRICAIVLQYIETEVLLPT